MLRQGRKYGLGGCIATQRIAYLNTNALQQLHTYFVSTLPRPYDRGLISNTFMIDKMMIGGLSINLSSITCLSINQKKDVDQ